MAGYDADSAPSRPYGGPGLLGGNAGRTEQLGIGMQGDDPANAASSLNQDAARWNTPAAYRPASILQPIMTRNPGGNGMSASDAARRTIDGQYLGSVNGSSASSFEPAAYLRLTGENSE